MNVLKRFGQWLLARHAGLRRLDQWWHATDPVHLFGKRIPHRVIKGRPVHVGEVCIGDSGRCGEPAVTASEWHYPANHRFEGTPLVREPACARHSAMIERVRSNRLPRNLQLLRRLGKY